MSAARAGDTASAGFKEKRGGWSTRHRSVKLGELLEPFVMERGGWREKLEQVTAVTGAHPVPPS